jgi:hypothetical protein
VVLNKLRDLARRELSGLQSLFLAHKLIALVCLPIILALWVGVGIDSNLHTQHALIFWGVVVIIGVAQVYFFIPTAELRFATESYFLADEALLEAEALKQKVKTLTSAQANYLAWAIMQRIYSSDEKFDKNRFLEAVYEFFRPILDNLGNLFGIMPGEIWTFTVYIYNRDDDHLYPVWRERQKGHPSKSPARSWQRGVGHVGVTFSKKEPVITADASQIDIFKSQNSNKPYDEDIYKSLAAIPIGSQHVAGDCIGVLIATSSAAGRFDLLNAYVLRVLASVIGNVILSSKIDPADLVK